MVSMHYYEFMQAMRRNAEFLAERGARVDLICLRWPGKEMRLGLTEVPGLKVHLMRMAHRRWSALFYPLEYLAFFFRVLPLVCALSLRHRYDVVQVDTVPDFLVFCAFVARWRRARVVLYMFEVMPEMTASRLGAPGGHPLVRAARLQERMATRWADHVITVSAACRRLLVGHGMPEAKLSVIPAIPSMPEYPDPVPPERPILITHGTLVERYGTHVIVQALPHLVRRWPNLVLWVLGEGEQLPRLIELAAALGVSDHFKYRGMASWKEAIEEVRQATLGVVPVLADGYGEIILPTKLMEYVSLGIPAVCSRQPAVQDYFGPESVAYFTPGDPVDLAAQVDRLLADPEQARRQAERARAALAHISWRNLRWEYLKALEPGR
jgi:glycosyltransferase involved in cell wall biosynthesis